MLILPLLTLVVLTVTCPFITVKASFGITSWTAFLILQAIQFACFLVIFKSGPVVLPAKRFMVSRTLSGRLMVPVSCS